MDFGQLSLPVRFGAALVLGLLVGLERESSRIRQKHRLYGGIRTYTFISLFGFRVRGTPIKLSNP